MGSTKETAKKPTVASLEKLVTELKEDQKVLTARLYEAEHVIKSLNIAIIGLAYSTKVSPKRINNADADKFLHFIEQNVHPIIRKSDELTSEVADKAKKEIAEQAKKAKEAQGES